MEMEIYKKITDPSIDLVNTILRQGYTLFSITPLVYGAGYNPKLVYHFIKEFMDQPLLEGLLGTEIEHIKDSYN